MKIATVIAGYENEDVLSFTAEAPLQFSEKVLFVDGIRPIIKRFNPTIPWNKYKDVPYSQDNTEKICNELGIIYLNTKRALYNGEKINIAKYYLDAMKIDYDLLLYLESDEAIEPKDIEVFKNLPCDIPFMSFDLLQLWKNYTAFRVSPSCSKLIINTQYNFPHGDEGHNATDVISISMKNIVSNIRMYHLHFFRNKAFSRIYNGKWYGGGDRGGIDIEKEKFKLERTDFLDKVYGALSIQEKNIYIKDERNTYIGVIGDELKRNTNNYINNY